MQKDFLSRQPYINLLKSIIANQSDNPSGYSLAIDGEWGCGKTWVLNKLENELLDENKNKYLIFHYNAWENDFYDEPLVAILSVMIEELKSYKKNIKEKETVSKAISSSITALTKVAGSVIEKKYGINANDIIDSVKESGKAIDDIKLTKSDFNNMLPLENALRQIKSVIQKLAEEYKIVFVVDELDRCLPEYAIKVLERLHHVCNEMPVIQIIAYSGKALSNSISKVYGSDSENNISKKAFAEHYLEKFVNLILPLNYGKPDDDISVLYEGLEKNYKPIFDSSLDFLKQFYKAILKSMPIRNRKKIFDVVKTIHELTLASNNFKNFISTYELLCCEILIVIDKIMLHAQSPLNLGYEYKENQLRLVFNADKKNRYSNIININYYISLIEQISVNAEMQQDPLFKNSWYNITVGDSLSFIFFSFVNDEKIQAVGGYSNLLGSTSTDIVHQNKTFIKIFYSLLYQFVF
jgi:hypothetical protein